ncbi:MAG TPA: hypothetical protein VFT87_01610 [Candidatus Saccharimonadales bacterium]|nr:hypothetical protein [Candidatus Saccharimonadales bacterium]
MILAVAAILVLAIGTSMVSSYRSTKLRWQLHEGHTPYTQRKMKRDLQWWTAAWGVAVCVGLPSGVNFLLLMHWFATRQGGNTAAILLGCGAFLLAMWLFIMLNGYAKFRKRQRWDFWGFPPGSE